MKKMNKSIKFLTMAFSIAVASVLISCGGDDDPIIIDEDPVVADGFYVLGTASSDTPAAALELGAGTVGSGETREGFYSAYIYLGAGSFNFVLYSNNIATVFGGASEAIALAGNAELTYNRGALSENGAAFTVATAGLYHVNVDLESNLYFVTRVDYFEIIGSATEDSWNSGQKLAVKAATADQVVFEGVNITLRKPGAYKFRYNSNWDTNIEDIDGLNIHSNFGVDGVAGGTDFTFDGNDGVYTVSVTYTPGSGESLAWNLTRTGDAAVITFDPNDYKLGVIGDATAGAWDADQNLHYKKDGSTHMWIGMVTLGATGEFKFRANDDWAFNLGGTLTLGTEGDLVKDGGNVASPGAGSYYVVIKTSDEGATWKGTYSAATWGIIGAATPGGWDADTDMTTDAFADGKSTYTVTVALTAGEYKFRANDAWDFNVGGDAAALTVDGGNLSTTEAGTYLVVLSFDGSVYSSTATKQ